MGWGVYKVIYVKDVNGFFDDWNDYCFGVIDGWFDWVWKFRDYDVVIWMLDFVGDLDG